MEKRQNKKDRNFLITCLATTWDTATTCTTWNLIFHLFTSSSSATTTAATSFIYYVMYLEVRFYDYLASSDVKIK